MKLIKIAIFKITPQELFNTRIRKKTQLLASSPYASGGSLFQWLHGKQLHARMSARSLQSYPTLCDPMSCIVHQASLSMGFSRQEY